VVYHAALEKDPFALEIFDRAGKYLGIAVASMLNIFNPEIVLFVGGMVSAGDFLLKPVIEEAKKRSFDVSFKHAKICYGELGNRAGVVGIGGIAWKSFFHQ